MLNGKRCFKSKLLINKAKSQTMISPIVVIEKLSMKIKENPFAWKKIISCNDSDSRKQVNKNNLKYKKHKRKYETFKNKNKEAIFYSSKSSPEKILKKCNNNVTSTERVNKLNSIQSVNDNNSQFNSALNNKFPRVVLERLSVKAETSSLSIPNPECNIVRSALTESEYLCNNKIKNEFDNRNNYLDIGTNYYDMDSLNKIEKPEITNEADHFKIIYEINEVNDDFANKDEINNDMQIEFEEIMYVDNEGIKNFVIKENTDNDVQTEFKRIVNGNNELIEDFVSTDYFVNTKTKENESQDLTYNEMNIALKSECFYEELKIEDNANGIIILHAEMVTDKSLIDESNNSSQNSNLSSQLITEFEVAVTNELDINKLFIYKCLECNIVKSHEGIRTYRKTCNVCDSRMYYVCLICQNSYASIYTIYNHLNQKHSVEKNKTNKLEKSKPNNNLTNGYLALAQYHDEQDEEVFRTVPDPISAHCLGCLKKVSATEKTGNWCNACKTTKYIFLCNYCSYIRKNYRQVRLHVLFSHAEKVLKCFYNCGRSFSCSKTLWQHMNCCQKYQSIDTVSHLTKLNLQLKDHTCNSTCNSSSSYCYKCGKYFETKQNMIEHVDGCEKLADSKGLKRW